MPGYVLGTSKRATLRLGARLPPPPHAQRTPLLASEGAHAQQLLICPPPARGLLDAAGAAVPSVSAGVFARYSPTLDSPKLSDPAVVKVKPAAPPRNVTAAQPANLQWKAREPTMVGLSPLRSPPRPASALALPRLRHHARTVTSLDRHRRAGGVARRSRVQHHAHASAARGRW